MYIYTLSVCFEQAYTLTHNCVWSTGGPHITHKSTGRQENLGSKSSKSEQSNLVAFGFRSLSICDQSYTF